MPNLTDLATIRALCEKHHFELKKGFGQNFIINPGVCPHIVEAAGIDETFGVLEIGPGIGVLTKELAARVKKVVAVEVDERLPALLDETLADTDNVKVVLGDVLKTDLHALIAKEFAGLRVAVCANLPYYITSPIVMKLLQDRLPIENITVMVQKEAAQRLTAAPGSRESGAVSYAVAYYAQPKLLFSVQPGSFYPAPKVTSAVIRLDILPQPPVSVPDEAAYFALIRAAFCQRRKTAANAIAAGLHLPKERIAQAIAAAGCEASVRPEKLTLEDFARIHAALADGPAQN
jgi:16S rRNA (adenine1518-N6/adenine1519-N6)-dimethyltransferase